MIIFPAIDLRHGCCVRLRQGDADRETVFDDDPLAVARRWKSQGAEWLHVVNLDGAFGEGGSNNLAALRRLLASLAIPIQFGGGIRSLEDIEQSLTMGVTRVILGTVAVRQPELVKDAIQRFGAERIVIGIDARDGQVAIHGWRNVQDIAALDLACDMADMGAKRIIYTDVRRDGMLSGVNVEVTRQLAQHSGLAVIASGGVRSLEDIRQLKALEDEGIEGVVIGMALYRGAFDLGRAIRVATEGASHVG